MCTSATLARTESSQDSFTATDTSAVSLPLVETLFICGVHGLLGRSGSLGRLRRSSIGNGAIVMPQRCACNDAFVATRGSFRTFLQTANAFRHAGCDRRQALAIALMWPALTRRKSGAVWA